jgi:hypothetical protein
MKTKHVFLAVVAVLAGVTMLIALPSGAFGDGSGLAAVVGILLLAAGLTFLWKHSGFRGLKPKE